MSDFFIAEKGREIREMNDRGVSSSTIYMNWGGLLLGKMLDEDGFNFAMSHFDFDKGTYIADDQV